MFKKSIVLDFCKKHAKIDCSAIITTMAAAALFLTDSLKADPLGLIGGQDSSGTGSPYAALISSTGTVTSLSPLPAAGLIQSVAINASGNGLIGGAGSGGSGSAYAALISSTGTVTPLSPLPAIDLIQSVAINASGNGLIGGGDITIPSSNPTYAALISPTGTVTPLSPLAPTGFIQSVAINASGNGLIGGEDFSGAKPAYAALISPTGTVTPLSPLPATGFIESVAINASGNGLIGGEDSTGTNPAYAAVISSTGTVTSLAPLPPSGVINSVAINASGNGLIGGQDSTGSGPAYAAVISSTGTVTPLSPLPGSGRINSVAINASGNGLIGGADSSGAKPAYAAMISSTGTVTSLSPLPATGVINSVAINASGNGLIGGRDATGSGSPYAALISSTGTVTILSSLPVTGIIESVAIIDGLLPLLSHIPTEDLSGNDLILANYINKNSPDTAFYFVPSVLDGTLSKALHSAAPTRHAFDLYTADNNFFFLINSFTQHAEDSRHYRIFQDRYCEENIKRDDTSPKQNTKQRSGNKKQTTRCPCELSKRRYQLWGKVLGALSHQKSQHQTPSFKPLTAGAILGFDAHVNNVSAYGIGAAYTYTDLHQKQHAGHSKINQEYLFVYGLCSTRHFYANAALWGGLFQINNTRNMHMTSFHFKASSRPKGWQLAPHVELGYHNTYQITTLEPFAMFDWVNNWQSHYEEKGGGPLNFGQKSHHSSFLRSEIGLRVSETIEFNSWRLVFQEKGSYVNRKPFSVGEVTAYLVGAPGSFTVETLTTPQNVGVAGGKILFESNNPCYPYGSVAYQGEFGLTYQSHQLSFNLAWNF